MNGKTVPKLFKAAPRVSTVKPRPEWKPLCWVPLEHPPSVPMALVNVAPKAVYQCLGMTPKTTLIHHIYDYKYPTPKDIPSDDVRIIWQAGRQCSYLGAPQTNRATGYGYVCRKPEDFVNTGVEGYVSYMQSEGQVLWVKLPEDYFIEEVYDSFPYNHLIDALEFGQRILSP